MNILLTISFRFTWLFTQKIIIQFTRIFVDYMYVPCKAGNRYIVGRRQKKIFFNKGTVIYFLVITDLVIYNRKVSNIIHQRNITSNARMYISTGFF